MAPARPDPPSSVAGPRPSAGRPRIFGGGTRRSTRIEKKSAAEKELGQKKDQGHKEVEPEQNVQPRRARPGLEFTETPPSRRSTRSALPSDRCLRSTRAPQNTTTQAHRTSQREYHTIAEGGPKLKNVAELLSETDLYQHFRIPSNKIIANEDIDRSVREQMQRIAPEGNLTPARLRQNLIDSVCMLEDQWHIRNKSRPEFWEHVCKFGGWTSQLDGADYRQFFLWLCNYFRDVPGKKGANNLIKAFERLVKLFRQEEKCELDELDGVQSRLRAPANRSSGRSGDSPAVGRGAVSRKRGSNRAPEDGNIFRWSGDTNMTDYELLGVDAQGLTPIVDVGNRRRKDEEQRRVFGDYMKALEAEDEERKGREAAEALLATAELQPTTQGRSRSSRKRSIQSEVGNSMPEMSEQNTAKAGRKFAEFEEDEEEDDWEEQERLRAAALKRQRLLERHAARGGPKSD